jgi:hypothetical protein
MCAVSERSLISSLLIIQNITALMIENEAIDSDRT